MRESGHDLHIPEVRSQGSPGRSGRGMDGPHRLVPRQPRRHLLLLYPARVMKSMYDGPADYINRTERTTEDAVNHYTGQLQELLAALVPEPDAQGER